MRNTPDHSEVELAAWRGLRNSERPAKATLEVATDHQALGWSSLFGQVRHVDQRWVRQVNRALVLACIQGRGPLSRVQIVEHTTLSRATVSAITHVLLHEGIIREGERVPPTSRGGRPAVLLHATGQPVGTSLGDE